MDGDKPVCYWRGLAKDFTEKNPSFQWIILKADRAIGKVKNDYDAGMISMRMSIFNKGPSTAEFPDGAIESDLKEQQAWKTKPGARSTAKNIRIFLFQCADIPSADKDGVSDCFIEVWNPDNEKKRTVVVEDTLNPIYYETIDISYDMPKQEKNQSHEDWVKSWPPIILNLFDQDLDGVDYLGRSVIYLSKASTNFKLEPLADDPELKKTNNLIPPPKWQDIRIGFDESAPPTGKVMCSFVISEFDFIFDAEKARDVNLQELVEKKEYQVDINVLGLRELESFGIVPVKKAFVKFMVRSLLPP